MDDWLERAAARRPDHPALVADGAALTYAELLEGARRAEPGLRTALGVHALLLRGGPVVVHTSGTTGEPKPVTLTAKMVEASARGTAELLDVRDDDRWLAPIPLHHVGGLMVLLRSVLYATTAVVAQHDPGATLASMVPTQLVRGLDRGMPKLRAILLGGGPVPPELRAHPLVRETYGMTETCSMVALDGVPLPGAEITIAPDGEIVVDGAMVADGPHRTGDLGSFEDGRLVVVGRKSDMIITGGENVAPAEVEGVLAEHPGVRDVAVVGRPHPEWGEALTALVVGDAGADELRAFARARLPGFKVPKRFEVVRQLPRTASGKLIRASLR